MSFYICARFNKGFFSRLIIGVAAMLAIFCSPQGLRANVDLPVRADIQSTCSVDVTSQGPLYGCPSQTTKEVSLSRSVIEAHGIDIGDSPVVYAHNFITHGMLTPDPKADIYLSMLGVACSHKGDSILSFPLPPGLEERWRALGIVDISTRVIEVPIEMGPSGRLGFPYSDLLSAAVRAKVKLGDGATLVTAFPGTGVSQNAHAIGAQTIQISEATLTNNKVEFHRASERYGFRVPQAMILQNQDDLREACSRWSHAKRVWLKWAAGSGGDFVLPIVDGLTKEKLHSALDRMRKVIARSIDQTDVDMSDLEHIWRPDHSILPADKLVLQQDATIVNVEGNEIEAELVANLSNSFTVRKDGSYVVHGIYEQSVGPEGDYLGSQPYRTIPADLQTDLTQQIDRVAQYAARELNFYGLVGLDIYVVRTQEKSPRHLAVMIELNGRPSISVTAQILANKLGVSHWLNLNMWTRHRTVNTVDDLDSVLTIDGYRYLPRSVHEINSERGFVVPQAMREIYRRDERGNLVLLESSNVTKILIGANSHERCIQIMNELKQNGVQFSKD